MSARSAKSDPTSSGSNYCLFGIPELHQPSLVLHANLEDGDLPSDEFAAPMVSADEMLKLLSTSDMLNHMEEMDDFSPPMMKHEFGGVAQSNTTPISSTPDDDDDDDEEQHLNVSDEYDSNDIMVVDDEGPRVTITMSHKPRGSKGKWIGISEGERIRITKGVGKRFKLDIVGNIPLNPSMMSVVLLKNGDMVADGYSIRSTKEISNCHIEMLIRIKEKARSLQMLADVLVDGDHIIGRSIAFRGHDTGKFKNDRALSPGASKESLPSPPLPHHHHHTGGVGMGGASIMVGDASPSHSVATDSDMSLGVVTAASLARSPKREHSPNPMMRSPYSSPSSPSPSSGHASPYHDAFGGGGSPASAMVIGDDSSLHAPSKKRKGRSPATPAAHGEGLISAGMMSTMLAANRASSSAKTTSFAGRISSKLFPTSSPTISTSFADDDDDLGGVTITPKHVIDGDLEVRGEVCARSFAQYSDARRKTDVEDLMGALDYIMNMQAKTYVWKVDKAKAEAAAERGEATSSPQRVIGLIAQEVQRVVPEVVQEDPSTGMLAVKYAELVPVLIAALKEHIFVYRRDQMDLEERAARLDDKARTLDKLVADIQKCSDDLAALKLCARKRTLLHDFHCVYRFHQGRLYVYAEQLYFQSGHKNCTTTVNFADVLAIEKKGKGDIKVTIQPDSSPMISTKVFTVGPRHYGSSHRRTKQQFAFEVLRAVWDMCRGMLKHTLEDIVQMSYARSSPTLAHRFTQSASAARLRLRSDSSSSSSRSLSESASTTSIMTNQSGRTLLTQSAPPLDVS